MQPDWSPATSLYVDRLSAARRAVQSGDYAAALRASMAALALDPGAEDALRPFAISAYRTGKFGAASRWIPRLSVVAPRETRYLSFLAESYMRIGDISRSRSAATRVLILDPAATNGYQLMGRAVSVSGDRGAAARIFRHMLALSGRDANVFKALIRTNFMADAFAEALKWTEEAVVEEGETAELLFWRGRLLRMLGRTDEAAAALDRAVGLDESYAFKRKLLELTLIEADFRLPALD